MKWLVNFIKSKSFLPLLVVLISGVLASRSLLFEKGYFNMHDDLQMMRQLSLEKCFLDGQIPCRWIPDMGYGYGFPLFNFYPPLPYLVGQILRVLSFSFVDTAKILFALAFILSGFAMYYLARQFFGKLGGVVASIFYVWAPYHSVDVYVRGAMNESWALIFFPLIFLFGYKVIMDPKKQSTWAVLLALSYFGLFTSHNLMIMIFTPIFAIWSLFWIFISRNYKSTVVLFVSGLTSLGLSSFFTLPAIFENDLTWLKSQLIGYYDYTAHFVTLNQLLISRFWGYGPSVWLEYDGMPFQSGHFHWILSLILGFWSIYHLYLNLRKNKYRLNFKFVTQSTIYLVLTFLFVVGWFSSFMTHVRSTPIYQAFDFIGLVQFPWRFLTLVIFAFSFLAGSIVLIVKNKYLVFLLMLALVGLNWNYFLPEKGRMGDLNDEQKFSGAAWDLQRTAGIYDYLPLTAKEAPKEPPKALVEVVDAKGEIVNNSMLEVKNVSQGTNWAKFETSGPEATIRVSIFDFPGWKVYLNGQPKDHYLGQSEKWGRIWIDLPEGDNRLELKFTDTPVRNISNIISIVTWLSLFIFLVVQLIRGRK